MAAGCCELRPLCAACWSKCTLTDCLPYDYVSVQLQHYKNCYLLGAQGHPVHGCSKVYGSWFTVHGPRFWFTVHGCSMFTAASAIASFNDSYFCIIHCYVLSAYRISAIYVTAAVRRLKCVYEAKNWIHKVLIWKYCTFYSLYILHCCNFSK